MVMKRVCALCGRRSVFVTKLCRVLPLCQEGRRRPKWRWEYRHSDGYGCQRHFDGYGCQRRTTRIRRNAPA